ncbi:MAG: tryptophan synthase subunit alpha [Candidatus Nitrosocaldaceae archaeon]|nr:MAG: tryptophan synthase subunit alpha [Candidatus Nitrosocaldaceae archaeon]
MISKKFEELKGKAYPLIGYAVAGYPSLDDSRKVIKAMINGGVDILEIGIPFSDPIADGPIIQKASYQALSRGITPKQALELCNDIRREFDIPIAIMTYCNILYRTGYEKFIINAKKNGVNGFIIPDLSLEEADPLRKLLVKNNMDLILLVSPNTSIDRIKKISNIASGFLYLVSVYGTTGIRSRFEDYTRKAIVRVKKYSKLPVGVGFGVSKPEHVRFMIDAGADAVIVGSAFIKAIDDGFDKVEELARDLKRACIISS